MKHTVRDTMSSHGITRKEEQSAEDAVTLFLRHDIHWILVVRAGVPVDMVSRLDLLRLMLHQPESGARP